MSKFKSKYLLVALSTPVSILLLVGMVSAQQSSYMPVDIKASFDSMMASIAS